MKLTARVVQVESGSKFKDGKQRLTLEFAEAANYGNKLVVPQDDKQSFRLDQEIAVYIEEPKLGIGPNQWNPPVPARSFDPLEKL